MTKQMCKLVSLLGVALMMAFLAPQRAVADDDDPPSRVARLGYLHGPVSFGPAGTDDWVDAVVNRPMTTGDKLWVDRGARAELHIGSASIRLSGNTGFSFLNLTDQMTQLRLTEGTLRIRVKRLDENESFEVDTPNLAFSVLRPGVYRISVNEGGDTTVIKIRGGEGEVTGGGSAYTVHAGESDAFNGTDQLIADMDSYGDDDDFDSWCADRDRREDRSASARYVSTDVIGYEDLDEYGGWRPVPDYGMVWFPHTTIVGWAPYRYGHWAYVHPWGYTWIDDAPWGFAPFHYGRWVNVGGWWGWVPCPPPAPRVVYVRPVYAPALVAWVGGPHFGVGVSLGWFPLGPREVYVPSYPVSRTYVNNVNVSNTTVNTTVINNYYNNTTVINRNTTVVNNNVTVIHQKYVNQTVPGAVTATTHEAFTSAQPVAKNVVQVNQREIAAAQVGGAPAIAPAKQAVLGSGAPASVRPPAALQTRAVVAKAPPPPPPVPFARQQQAIQANGGKPLAVSQVRQIEPASAQVHPNVRIAPPSTPVASQNLRNNNPVTNNPGNNKPGQPLANAGNNVPLAGQGNRPANPGMSNSVVNNNDNRSAGANQKSYNDRPPAARPASGMNNTGASVNSGAAANNGPANNRGAANNGGGFNNRGVANNNAASNNVRPQMEEKHQQQIEDLRAKQDRERQKVEQQQQQEQQKLAQKNADEQRQSQINQKHQAQLQQLENKHDSEQQKLQQKQQQERGKPASKEPAPRDKDDRQQHSK